MTQRERRREKRMKTMVVEKKSLHCEDNSALHIGLSPLESWEVLTRISKESWFLQTGKVAPMHLDKSKITILKRD